VTRDPLPALFLAAGLMFPVVVLVVIPAIRQWIADTLENGCPCHAYEEEP
jgi:hypothetical protein